MFPLCLWGSHNPHQLPNTVYDPLLTPPHAPPAPTSTPVMLTSRCAFIVVLQSPATLPSTAWAQPPGPHQHAPSFHLCTPEPNLNQEQLILGPGADLQCLGTDPSTVSL